MMKILSEGFKRSTWWIRASAPFATWKIATNSPNIYLTFDDGPTTGVTDPILDILKEYGAKATFFCVGSQAEKSPDLLQRISNEGHSIGNHTYSHVNGLRTDTSRYVQEVSRANQVLESILHKEVRLFRPPYGRIRWSAWRKLRATFRCIMWDVTSQDFLEQLSPDDVVRTVIQFARPGSIVLFHDSTLAAPRVLQALPVVLESLKQRRMHFESIS